MKFIGEKEHGLLMSSLRDASDSMTMLKKQVEELTEERDRFKKRTIMLENAFKKEQGISIRQDITQVIVDFDKVEMVIIMAALTKMISTGMKTPEDAEYVLKLLRKIEGFVNKMEEPKDDGKDK